MAASGVCTRAPRPVTVLFVDDDEDARFAYRLIGTEVGMSVELACDGHEAIALANVLLPDVIVLDLGLRSPDGLNGLEVAHRLRADSRTATIPIVFLSGYDGPEDVAAMRESGCEGYLVKPCSAEDVLGLVTALAMSRRDQAITVEARALIG
jgi:CheY-like chemotaxis protein